MKIILFTFLLLNIQLISSILIETGKKDRYCFYKNVDQGDTVHLSYIISGENEEKVNAILIDENQNRILYEQHNSDSGDFKQTNFNGGKVKLCFLPLNANNYYISFEFFTLLEKGHTLDMAKDQNLHEMKKDVTDITLMFEEMEKNIRFIMDRRNKHSLVINDIIQSIKRISYLKILVVIMVSLLQVFLIHKFFGNGNKSSLPSYNYSHKNVYDIGGSNL